MGQSLRDEEVARNFVQASGGNESDRWSLMTARTASTADRIEANRYPRPRLTTRQPVDPRKLFSKRALTAFHASASHAVKARRALVMTSTLVNATERIEVLLEY